MGPVSLKARGFTLLNKETLSVQIAPLYLTECHWTFSLWLDEGMADRCPKWTGDWFKSRFKEPELWDVSQIHLVPIVAFTVLPSAVHGYN